MNVTAINTLAGLLENIPPETMTGFNMEHYQGEVVENDEDAATNVTHSCGTTACIAGWAALYLSEDGKSILTKKRSHAAMRALATCHGIPEPTVARKLLKLDPLDAHLLFEPMNMRVKNFSFDWDQVTPQQAAKVLRHLAETGSVNWEVAFS